MSRMWAVLIAAALVGAPAAVSGQVTIGPTLAYEGDVDFGIGASLGTTVDQLGEGFGLLADFLIFFPNAGNYFEVNGNVTYDIPIEDSSLVPFLLGGLNIGRSSVDVAGVSASSTDLGLNIGGGIDFDLGNFRPTAGVRAAIRDGSPTIIFITLPLQTGGS